MSLASCEFFKSKVKGVSFCCECCGKVVDVRSGVMAFYHFFQIFCSHCGACGREYRVSFESSSSDVSVRHVGPADEERKNLMRLKELLRLSTQALEKRKDLLFYYNEYINLVWDLTGYRGVRKDC